MTIMFFNIPPVARRPRLRARSLFFFAAWVMSPFLVTGQTQAIGPQDRRLTNVKTGISVEAPAGWTLSQHTGYGDTVVLLLHPDGSRISVAVAITPARDAVALFEQNRRGLVADGLRPSPGGRGPRGSLAVDLFRPGQGDRVRQLYLVRDIPGGHQAIVLTLIGRPDSFAAHSSALDFVATRLGLDDPAATPGSTRADNPIRGASGRDVRGGSGGHGGEGGAGRKDAGAKSEE